METIIKELKKLVQFKDTTDVGDIVLIVAKKPQMLVYGLVYDITRDETKRDEWWQVSMHMLSLPPRQVVWTLRTPQMTGLEIFTMEGEERFMKAISFETGKQPHPKKGTEKKDKAKTSLRRIK
jgi:hypothetical protein